MKNRSTGYLYAAKQIPSVAGSLLASGAISGAIKEIERLELALTILSKSGGRSIGPGGMASFVERILNGADPYLAAERAITLSPGSLAA